MFESGKVPHFSTDDLKVADAELNQVYNQVMAGKDLFFEVTTVKPEGIKIVEKKWLPYRDAWIKFGSVRYPKVTADTFKTLLTKERVNQLRQFHIYRN
jgi:uncharacterized protein YecT (DUF1311 family)